MTDEKIIPAAKELLDNGGLDFDFGYVREAESVIGSYRRQWRITT